jgi:DDE superfamily endonuclease
MRLRTLADVVACAAVHGVEPRIDATETQVRPAQGQPARSAAFVSGKRKQNTIKTTVVSDGQGRTLWAGAVRPGRVLDQTAGHHRGHQGAAAVLPTVTAGVDTGYRGWPRRFRSDLRRARHRRAQAVATTATRSYAFSDHCAAERGARVRAAGGRKCWSGSYHGGNQMG